MEVGKIISVTLASGWWYHGELLENNENDVVILDKKGDRVTILKDSIIAIREVSL